MHRLLLLLGLNLCLCAGIAAQPEISAGELKKKMAGSDSYTLIDVRTPGEVMDGYIEGAVNIDVKADDFESRIASLDKSGTYYVYCASGVRSARAARIMLEHGFKPVYSLQGGIRAWRDEKFPLIKPE